MIQAEISIYPMATKTTSASFYIAKAIESIKDMENLRYEINSMGTILEEDAIESGDQYLGKHGFEVGKHV